MFTAASMEASLELPGSWWSSSSTAGSSIQLTITTNEPDGLLFYVLLNHGDDERASFLALQLFEGELTYRRIGHYRRSTHHLHHYDMTLVRGTHIL